MTRRSAALALALSVVCASCAAPLRKLPSGPGVPAQDAPDVILAATSACRPLSAISFELAVSGSIAGGRVRGRLLAGVTRVGAVRLEAIAPAGQPVFILTNSVGFVQPDATLLLPRDNRFLERGQFGSVLEAVTGIPLDKAVLFSVLTGCVPSVEATGNALGEDWRRVAAGLFDVYVHREKEGSWRLEAMLSGPHVNPGWRAEYGQFQDGLPRSIRLVSGWPGAFDLQLAMSQVELNPSFGDEVFRIKIPGSAKPITLDELRASGPLGTNRR